MVISSEGEYRRNAGTNYGETGEIREYVELSRTNGHSKDHMSNMGNQESIWKSKRSSSCEEDAPSIYRKWGVKSALNEDK